jgi:hypothetical protein
VRRLLQRLSVISLFVSVVLSGFVGVGPASAVPRDPRQIVPGAIAVGGSVTGPGFSAPRTFSAEKAGRFMQSWLAYSILTNPLEEVPPKAAPVYHIEVRQLYLGRPYLLKVSYATLGPKAWVTMPAGQELGWASVDAPHWIVAQALTITAFHNAVGDLPAVPASTSPLGTSSDGGTSTWVWVAIAVLGGIIVLALVLGLRTRMRKVPA